MRIPSIKTLMSGLHLTREQSQQLRDAMAMGRGLKLGNELLKGFGVETIGLPDGCFDNCQAPEIEIQYVNMGDTYATTLLRVNGQYRVGNWGDIVEGF